MRLKIPQVIKCCQRLQLGYIFFLPCMISAKIFGCGKNSAKPSADQARRPSGFRHNLRLFYYTFFYNEMNDSYVALEALLQPMIFCVDNFVRLFGKLFVTLVWALTINMLFLFYFVMTPEMYKESVWSLLVHFTLGNWLAVNTVFHYYMGWRTSPGHPPTTKFDNVVTMCNKCVGPKPPRTHHCSVCAKCVLKMDHHCPWFDNCIGFYNHRYFFLYCTYMTIDCLYLVTFGFYYFQKYAYPNTEYSLLGLITTNLLPDPANTDIPGSQTFYRIATVEFFVAFAAMFALFGLASFNAFIISNGATNIEIKSIPCFSRFFQKNPPKHIYDFGFVNNWKIFLGFSDWRSFIARVIFPSNHLPLGDGVNWKPYFDFNESTKSNKHDIFNV